MKQFMKRSFALLMALVLVLGLLPGISLEANAATVDYQYGSTSQHSNYSGIIKNWGKRGELATFLSPNAEAFYSENGTSYEALAALAGNTSFYAIDTSALYAALNGLMKQAHTTKTDYDEIRDLTAYTDCEGGNINSVSLIYSGVSVSSAWDKGATWNREHIWPDSKGGSSKAGSSKNNESDIMIIRPENPSTNTSRGNKAYGNTTTADYYYPNLSYDVRGDVARSILYAYVRWGTEQSVLETNMFGATGVISSQEVLLMWMEADPVDTWEMGRNDSVQSITGTRNVFVDYPELAFELFEVEVPEMDTPSGKANAAGHTITARSNNTAWGTVSVNGDNITAFPAYGYKVSGYTVVSGNAAVTQSGNVFTVSTAGDCVIQINFAALAEHTVRIYENGTMVSAVRVKNGESYQLPAYSGTLPDGYSFHGWVTNEITTATAQRPAAICQPGMQQMIESDCAFYALLSYLDEDDQSDPQYVYKLVDSADKIIVGKSYVIAAANANVAMSITQKENNRKEAAITKSGNTLSFEPDAGVAEFVLGKGTAGTQTYSFYDAKENGYLYAAGSGNNYLRTQSTLDNNGSFAITVNTDGSCTVVAQGSNTNNYMRYNNNNKLFACYLPTSTTMRNVALYVGVPDNGTAYYTTGVTAEAKPVRNWGIILSEDIGVTFELDLTQFSEFTGIAVNGEPVKYTRNGDQYTVHLAAAQMTDEITILDEDTPLEKTYTVAKYAKTIIDGDYPRTTKELVANMLAYGGAAQIYFNYRADTLANAGISVAEVTVPAEDTALNIDGSIEDVKFYGASLLHKSKTAVRFYFKGSAGGMTVQNGNSVLDKVTDGDCFYVDVGGIDPQELGDVVTVTVTNDSGAVLRVSYSPLSYIVRMYAKGDTVMQNLVKALYGYYLSAAEYKKA